MASPFDPLDRLLPWKEVRPLVGNIGAATAWRWRRLKLFPEPVVLSPGRVAWRLSDIMAWIASRQPRPTSGEAA